MCNMRDTRLFVLYLYFMLCRFAKLGVWSGVWGMGRGGNRKNILCTPHGNEKNTFLAIGNGCQLAMLPFAAASAVAILFVEYYLYTADSVNCGCNCIWSLYLYL